MQRRSVSVVPDSTDKRRSALDHSEAYGHHLRNHMNCLHHRQNQSARKSRPLQPVPIPTSQRPIEPLSMHC